MSNKMVTWNKVWRCSVVVMVIVTIFWVVWYLVAGSVPETTQLKMTKDLTLVLPFAIYRWWNIGLAGLYAAIFALLFSKESEVTAILTIAIGITIGIIHPAITVYVTILCVLSMVFIILCALLIPFFLFIFSPITNTILKNLSNLLEKRGNKKIFSFLWPKTS